MSRDAYIQTYTGRLVNPFDIKEGDISIEDIAHSLSMQCRFNGNTNKFYSVAEHSINVSLILRSMPAKTQLLGLLHDATEAYLSDIPTPVKKYLPDYLSIEEKLSTDIYRELHPQYGDLSVNDFYLVNLVDKELTVLEGRGFMGGDVWDEMPSSFNFNHGFSLETTRSIEEIEDMFLELYNSLWKEIANEQAANRAGSR